MHPLKIAKKRMFIVIVHPNWLLVKRLLQSKFPFLVSTDIKFRPSTSHVHPDHAPPAPKLWKHHNTRTKGNCGNVTMPRFE